MINLNILEIASPCPASWAEMHGDERIRFCDSCSKHVYNLSDLTADEAGSLIQKNEGRVCLRLYRRKDGTVLTADCPVGVRYALRRRLLRLATTGVMALAFLRSSVWLYANGVRLEEYPVPPSGPAVTVGDWADWASQALGLSLGPAPGVKPTPMPVRMTMGIPCRLPTRTPVD